MSERNRKIEFGDFQTPLPLAEAVCALLRRSGVCPRTAIEPSCGEGSFLEAAMRFFGSQVSYFGFDVNPEYIGQAEQRLANRHPDIVVHLQTQDFFTFDWEAFLQQREPPILFLGNPPWVTNASLGVLGAGNLPQKSNLKGLSGLNARTGKANFDISEWMLLKLAYAAAGSPFTFAMLCKTSVTRKAVEYYWKHDTPLRTASLFRIDSLKWFGASVDSCLFLAHFGSEGSAEKSALFYAALDSTVPERRFGLVDGEMVSSVEDYQELRHLSGVNYYRWRSGVKHDLAKVMELETVEGQIRNGFGLAVDVEDSHLYPLLKASDIAKGLTTPTRFVLIPQNAVGEDTTRLRHIAPRTWKYLEQYDALFLQRKSSIYRNQPKYCLFGIGAYSFSPFKVAVSSLHKEVRFTLIPPYQGKPVFVDDTCYFVGSFDESEACLLHELFMSDVTQRFLRAVVFSDSKRPITAEVLNRIDVKRVAEQLGQEEDLVSFLNRGTIESNGQGVLAFEQRSQYAGKDRRPL